MPLADVLTSVGTAAPEQIVDAVPKLNVGVMFGSTLTTNVVVIAHGPALGVNI